MTDRLARDFVRSLILRATLLFREKQDCLRVGIEEQKESQEAELQDVPSADCASSFKEPTPAKNN